MEGDVRVALKLIHVGLGGWGMDWELNAIPPVKGQVERVAIVDAYEPMLENARKKLKLKNNQAFATLDDAMTAVEADAVLITAPMEAHVPLAIQAMRAGKHVLVEKPFAGSVEEAEEAVKVADETGKVLQVSQNYRFYPAPRTVAKLVSGEKLGAVGTVNVDFRHWGNDPEPGTHRHYRFVHPLLFDMSIHHFDLMRMVLGKNPVRVYAQQTDPSWSKFVEEASASVIVTFEDDTVVSYRGSWVSSGTPTFWAGDWHMECEQGEIAWTSRQGGAHGTKGDKVTLRPRMGKETAAELEKMPVWGRSASLLALIEAIETGVEPENSGRRNLGSLALMEAAAKSLASGEAEDVLVPELGRV
jgi:predicted dehydrogenase